MNIDLVDIKNLIEKENKKEENKYNLFNYIITLLKKFEGKKITKRIESNLQKYFPAKVDVSYRYNFWSLQIINKNAITYEYNGNIFTIDLSIGSNFEIVLSYDDNYYEDNCIKANPSITSAAKERIEKRKNELNNYDFKLFIDLYVKAVQATQEFTDNINLLTDKYVISDFIAKKSLKFPSFLP